MVATAVMTNGRKARPITVATDAQSIDTPVQRVDKEESPTAETEAIKRFHAWADRVTLYAKIAAGMVADYEVKDHPVLPLWVEICESTRLALLRINKAGPTDKRSAIDLAIDTLSIRMEFLRDYIESRSGNSGSAEDLMSQAFITLQRDLDEVHEFALNAMYDSDVHRVHEGRVTIVGLDHEAAA